VAVAPQVPGARDSRARAVEARVALVEPGADPTELDTGLATQGGGSDPLVALCTPRSRAARRLDARLGGGSVGQLVWSVPGAGFASKGTRIGRIPESSA